MQVVSLQQLKQKMIDEYGEEPPDLPVVAASLPSTPQALAEASGLNSPRSTGHRTRTKHGKYLPQGSPLPGVSKVEARGCFLLHIGSRTEEGRFWHLCERLRVLAARASDALDERPV
eukprot:995802-Pleurochrysis_carterae.AAC.1